MKNFHSYILTGSLIATSALFSIIGYFEKGCPDLSLQLLSAEELPLVCTMNSLHDQTLLEQAKVIFHSSYPSTFRVSLDDEDVALNNTPEEKPQADHPPFHYTSHPFNQFLLEQCMLLDKLGISNPYEVVNLAILTKNSQANNLFITKEIFDTYKKQKEQAIKYEFSTVDESYFEDAVFLGDSRTVGIQSFSGIDNATFLCAPSLTIYDYDKKKIPFENKKTTIRDVLTQNQFKKVYIMFGINECGYGTTQDYLAQYKKVITDIKTLQPDALIFIQANLGITAQKSDSSKTITNDRLFERNAAVKTLANQRDIFYIDINESTLCEKDGSLVSDYTWDQVHIKAQYYPIWKEFFLTHGIVKS